MSSKPFSIQFVKGSCPRQFTNSWAGEGGPERQGGCTHQSHVLSEVQPSKMDGAEDDDDENADDD